MTIKKSAGVFILLVLFTVAISTAAMSDGPGAGYGNGIGTGLAMGPGFGYNLPAPVNLDLSDTEISDLFYMREEEQMAYDLYERWSQMYPSPIFSNIAQAEKNHLEEVQFLLDRYNVESYNVGNLSAGYSNPEIQSLALSLVAEGDSSLENAYRAGISIEEHDIADLDTALSHTSREDLQQVYMNLRDGSYNHLKAFKKALGVY